MPLVTMQALRLSRLGVGSFGLRWFPHPHPELARLVWAYLVQPLAGLEWSAAERSSGHRGVLAKYGP